MKIVGILIVIVVVLLLLVAYLAYRKVFHEGKNRQGDKYMLPKGAQYQTDREKMLGLIKMLDDIPYEEVWIRAYDGARLFGRYYHVADGAPLHIQMHGYRGFGIRDFCGGNKIARESGQNTLIIDQRAHGKSESSTMTFGVREQRDCLSWVAYGVERFGADTPIFLSGVSMGAATVLLAAGNELPPNVLGVIADCPYSSAKEIICKVCADMKLPPRGVFPLIRLSARLFGRFDIMDGDVAAAVTKAKVPILLIHGEADFFVPHTMSEKIYQANPKLVQKELFPDAGHGISYIVDTERYTKLSLEFVDKCLGKL